MMAMSKAYEALEITASSQDDLDVCIEVHTPWDRTRELKMAQVGEVRR
jgi:hypothetical protein